MSLSLKNPTTRVNRVELVDGVYPPTGRKHRNKCGCKLGIYNPGKNIGIVWYVFTGYADFSF